MANCKTIYRGGRPKVMQRAHTFRVQIEREVWQRLSAMTAGTSGGVSGWVRDLIGRELAASEAPSLAQALQSTRGDHDGN